MGGAVASGAVAAGVVAPGDVAVSHARPLVLEILIKLGAVIVLTNDYREAV